MFRSSEKIISTLLSDIIFNDESVVPFVYRDPEFLQTKRENSKSLASYGIIAKFSGHSEEYGPYALIKVFCF